MGGARPGRRPCHCQHAVLWVHSCVLARVQECLRQHYVEQEGPGKGLNAPHLGSEKFQRGHLMEYCIAMKTEKKRGSTCRYRHTHRYGMIS